MLILGLGSWVTLQCEVDTFEFLTPRPPAFLDPRIDNVTLSTIPKDFPSQILLVIFRSNSAFCNLHFIQ